jgi:hypothetical protein
VAVEGRTRIERGRLIEEAFCGDGVCAGPNCSCVPAKVYLLDSRYQLKYSEAESFSETRNEIGVGFSKQSKVSFPKTKDARLLK